MSLVGDKDCALSLVISTLLSLVDYKKWSVSFVHYKEWLMSLVDFRLGGPYTCTTLSVLLSYIGTLAKFTHILTKNVLTAQVYN